MNILDNFPFVIKSIIIDYIGVDDCVKSWFDYCILPCIDKGLKLVPCTLDSEFVNGYKLNILCYEHMIRFNIPVCHNCNDKLNPDIIWEWCNFEYYYNELSKYVNETNQNYDPYFDFNPKLLNLQPYSKYTFYKYLYNYLDMNIYNICRPFKYDNKSCIRVELLKYFGDKFYYDHYQLNI